MAYIFEGFNHDAWSSKRPDPGYMDGTLADLRRLPQVLQDDAVLIDAGEASWSRDLIAAAVNALADLGCPLRHLYCLAYDHEGRPCGVQQIANATEDDVEATRQRMIESLADIPTGERGFLIWDVTSPEARRRD